MDEEDVAVTEPEEVVETPPEETPAEETSTEEASPSLFDRVKQISGLDLSGKYADEDEALRGLAEAARLVGIRNEKSELFDQLNEAIKGREQEFQEWLAGEEAKAAPVVTDNGELPRSVDEYRLLQAQLFDERGQPRKDADPAAVRKVQQMNRRLQEVAVVINPLMEIEWSGDWHGVEGSIMMDIVDLKSMLSLVRFVPEDSFEKYVPSLLQLKSWAK